VKGLGNKLSDLCLSPFTLATCAATCVATCVATCGQCESTISAHNWPFVPITIWIVRTLALNVHFRRPEVKCRLHRQRVRVSVRVKIMIRVTGQGSCFSVNITVRVITILMPPSIGRVPKYTFQQAL